MEQGNIHFKQNLQLRGRLVSPILLAFLITLNVFLVLFTNSSSFNLDFFVIFSFLILIFGINREEGFLNTGTRQIEITPFLRNASFLIVAVSLLSLVSWYQFGFNPSSGEFTEKIIRLERVFHLFFSMGLLLILYKTILIDFSILITVVLFAGLFYHLALKNSLELTLNIDYLKFLFQGQDIRKEIESLLNNINTQNEKPIWENTPINQKIMETLLVFTGVVNNIFNTFYFIILTRVVGIRILNIPTRLSQIHFPRKWAIIFGVNFLALWLFLNFSGIFTITDTNAPTIERLIGETIIASFLTFISLYLIQGFSILFAYSKEKKFLGQPILRLSTLLILALVLGVSSLFGIGLMVWANLLFIYLVTLGFTDTWIDYRKNYRYQNFLAD